MHGDEPGAGLKSAGLTCGGERDRPGADLLLVIARDEHALALEDDENDIDARRVDRDELPRLEADEERSRSLALAEWDRMEPVGGKARERLVVRNDAGRR